MQHGNFSQVELSIYVRTFDAGNKSDAHDDGDHDDDDDYYWSKFKVSEFVF